MTKKIFALALLIFAASPRSLTVDPPKPMPISQIGTGISTDKRAEVLKAYFLKRNMPLAAYAEEFVQEADKAGIDWRLLPAIGIHESTGGKRYPIQSNNPFGWGSAKLGFSSVEEAIRYISDQLGNGKHYKGKSTLQKLQTYNPPDISPNYAVETIGYMRSISSDQPVK